MGNVTGDKVLERNDLDAAQREVLSRLAQRIEQLGITAPAILFLETYKPLAFLGAQFLWFAQPFLSLGFSATDVREIAHILEVPGGVESLIARLETTRTAKPARRA